MNLIDVLCKEYNLSKNEIIEMRLQMKDNNNDQSLKRGRTIINESMINNLDLNDTNSIP